MRVGNMHSPIFVPLAKLNNGKRLNKCWLLVSYVLALYFHLFVYNLVFPFLPGLYHPDGWLLIGPNFAADDAPY